MDVGAVAQMEAVGKFHEGSSGTSMEDAARVANVNIAMRRRRFTTTTFRRPRARGENKIWRHSPGEALPFSIERTIAGANYTFPDRRICSASALRYGNQKPPRGAELRHQRRLGNPRAAGLSQFGHPQPEPGGGAPVRRREHPGALSFQDRGDLFHHRRPW